MGAGSHRALEVRTSVTIRLAHAELAHAGDDQFPHQA